MKIEKEIGDGEDYVYVFYNENDKRLARLENRDRWECKIGFSSVDPIQRILDQDVQSAMAREPVIGLLIRTPNGYYTESRLHKELFQYKIKRTSKLVGDEWFLTNPTEIENVFLNHISPTSNQLAQYCEYIIEKVTDLGEKTNFHRKKINLTSRKLAEMSNVSRDTIWRFFIGDQTIGLSTVMKVLDIMGLEITLKSKLPSNQIKKFESVRKVR
jgi:DNA-binding phage protein